MHLKNQRDQVQARRMQDTPKEKEVCLKNQREQAKVRRMQKTLKEKEDHLMNQMEQVTCFYQRLRLCSCGTKPQHSGNRSLPLSTLLVVSWQMCHARNTHGMASRAVLVTTRLHGSWNYITHVPKLCFTDKHMQQMAKSHTNHFLASWRCMICT